MQEQTVRAIESHVRSEHLHRNEGREEDEDDGEEEFYYTEIEAEGGEGGGEQKGRQIDVGVLQLKSCLLEEPQIP